jgi:hypothetical protein
MKLEETKLHCQLPFLDHLSEGVVSVPEESFSRRAKVMIRRHLSPARERAFKNHTNKWMNRLCRLASKDTKPRVSLPSNGSSGLRAGDWVRVRSLKEIESTLNHWGQVRGCAFMPEMASYCDTIHRVFKPMMKFLDERDLQVKKSAGIILLEGVMCNGTAGFGSCDRSCLHFWREEWLQKLEEEPRSTHLPHASQQPAHFARVRSLREIEATLDQDRQLRGCAFMPEMAEYCGITLRVLKPVRRFFDERDFKIKTSSGISLLDGVICKGTAEFGSCDRSCFYVWREEWLEMDNIC